MGFELTIILLVVISVISALINKVLEARRRRELDEEDRGFSPVGRHGADTVTVEGDVDFPEEEDVFRAPKPGGEFREVRGTRRVSEADTGDEFREIRGARPVSEAYKGEEFREVDIVRPDEERVGSAEMERARLVIPAAEAGSAAEKDGDPSPEILPLARVPRRGTRRRKIDLDFKPQTVRKAIIYQEILGPPVADRMR
jgi:hypothetical protein